MLRFLSLCLLLFIFSCSDGDSGTGPGNNNNGISLGNFRMDVDGIRWNATEGAVFAYVSTSGSNSVAVVTASKSISASVSEAISLTIGDQVTDPSGLEGTYKLDGTASAALSFVTTDTEEVISYLSFDGEITINKVSSNNVSGVFNARCINVSTLTDTLSITNGSFNAERFTSP